MSKEREREKPVLSCSRNCLDPTSSPLSTSQLTVSSQLCFIGRADRHSGSACRKRNQKLLKGRICKIDMLNQLTVIAETEVRPSQQSELESVL